MTSYDAVVVGAGPNGLAAAITLARAGWSVAVYEAKDTVGGGARTMELTLPGFWHDVCSAIHPLAVGSPFFRSVPLHDYGVEWVHPDIPLAHPFDDGTAGVVARSLDETGESLGQDAAAYRALMEPFVERWDDLAEDILGPLRVPPRHPFLMAHFGLSALQSARRLAERRFKGMRARATFAGLAAHSFLPLERLVSAAAGIVEGVLAHRVGWPFPRGGSQQIANALAAYLRALGGEVFTGTPIESMGDLPPARAALFDVTPRQMLRIAGDRLPAGYRRALSKYRYGPAAFKVDWALGGPIPWTAAECCRAGTLHLGGTLEEIAASERAIWQGVEPEAPFMLVAQQSVFDSSRAPAGQHAAWGYCHVPHGSTADMTERMERQIERYAPGFRDLIVARSTMATPQLEAYNANYVGGDIVGGVQDLGQLFTRPTVSPNPYATPARGIYFCSSSTPPGGGVHGMCGYWGARSALEDLRPLPTRDDPLSGPPPSRGRE